MGTAIVHSVEVLLRPEITSSLNALFLIRRVVSQQHHLRLQSFEACFPFIHNHLHKKRKEKQIRNSNMDLIKQVQILMTV